MLIFIYGASASGKSEYAEHLSISLSQNAPKIYLATMDNKGEENLKRIKRHRLLREGKGFVTIEAPRDIQKIIINNYFNNNYINNSSLNNELITCDNSTVLLECLSNLVANEMFWDDKIISEKIVKNKIINELNILNKKINNLIIVSNNIFEDGNIYDEGTNAYIRALSAINEYLVSIADEAFEVVVGIPCPIK